MDQLGKLAEEFRFTLSMSTGKNAEKAFHQSIESVKNSSTAPNYIRTLSKGMNRWDNIFGYDCVKTKIKDFLYGPVRFADRYSRFGIGLPTGILFYGAPGCGKSFCVQAIANDGIFNVLEIQM